MVSCSHCNKELDLKAGDNVPRSERCDYCGFDLRVCKMCEFYDKSAYNECREPSADRIVEKEKANFCDYFKLSGGAGANDSKSAALAAAEALFKK